MNQALGSRVHGVGFRIFSVGWRFCFFELRHND